MMEYTFKVRNNWWLNAGLAGLYLIAVKDALRDKREELNIEVVPKSIGLTFQAENIDDLRSFLRECYEHLAGMYWNISSASQREKQELVIYDREKDELKTAPRRMPIPPIQKVLSARSWKAEGEKYENLPESLKKRVDEFLSQTNKKLWGKDEKLLYEPPICHDTEIKILPKEKSKKKTYTCCICGQEHTEVYDIAQPIYFLFASASASRSFHSQARKLDAVCWECNFLSKFAYECIHYKTDNDTMIIISPNSPNLNHLLKLQDKLGCRSALRAFDDQYFLKNIGVNKDELLYYANKPYELLWAFYFDAYDLLKRQYDLKNENVNSNINSFLQELIGDILGAPTEVVLLFLETKGQTFITKDLIIYQDTAYMFRLFSALMEKDVNLKQVFEDLYDTMESKIENRALKRNEILKKVLNKHPILQDMEEFCFSKIVSNNGFLRMRNMLLFIMNYQLIIRGDSMTKEQIEAAVNLGKQIVLQAKQKLNNDEFKKIKGDLFKLRKTRTATDFLNQLNNLQFRYGISVSKPIQEGLINDVNFEDFRAYCILGALNVYNGIMTDSKKGDVKDGEN
ncbi:hypothetical protein [Tepidanaerobacter syntrophicus]|uniref:hypothetical protein n=1 Tax=Tepidanaerobacter syntrophicus TaxID=224999 RepID=UPI001BD5158A|nr:hypothetical protein [Tepidanaerobacter syntrophicus]